MCCVQAVQLDTLTKDPGFSLWCLCVLCLFSSSQAAGNRRTRHYVNEEGDAVRDLEKMTGIRMLWRSVCFWLAVAAAADFCG